MFDFGDGSRATRLAVIGAGVALGVFLFVLKVIAGLETEPTRDVAAEAEVHALTGGVSQVVIIIWGLIAGAALVAGLEVRRRGRGEESLFLLTAVAGIAVLGIDDALLLHEDVIPNHLGLGKEVTFPLLGVVAALWAFRFRALILESDLSLLALIVFGGLLATVVDVFELWSNTGEDWIKYVAIIALAGWVVDLALRLLSEPRPRHARAAATPPPGK